MQGLSITQQVHSIVICIKEVSKKPFYFTGVAGFLTMEGLYQHSTLAHSSSIRVLRLSLAMDNTDAVTCNQPQFEARSYAWGDRELWVSIECTGQSFPFINPNLFSALRQLLQSNGARIVWVESLVIKSGAWAT